MCTLEVKIYKAENVINADLLSKSDPYCCVQISHNGKIKKASFHQTKTIKDDLNPVWNETVTLYAWSKGDQLDFWVQDEDVVGKGDFLGACTLTSEQIQQGFDGKLPLSKGKDAFLHVRVTLTTN